jgi:hypothetical protein
MKIPILLSYCSSQWWHFFSWAIVLVYDDYIVMSEHLFKIHEMVVWPMMILKYILRWLCCVLIIVSQFIMTLIRTWDTSIPNATGVQFGTWWLRMACLMAPWQPWMFCYPRLTTISQLLDSHHWHVLMSIAINKKAEANMCFFPMGKFIDEYFFPKILCWIWDYGHMQWWLFFP